MEERTKQALDTGTAAGELQAAQATEADRKHQQVKEAVETWLVDTCLVEVQEKVDEKVLEAMGAAAAMPGSMEEKVLKGLEEVMKQAEDAQAKLVVSETQNSLQHAEHATRVANLEACLDTVEEKVKDALDSMEEDTLNELEAKLVRLREEQAAQVAQMETRLATALAAAEAAQAQLSEAESARTTADDEHTTRVDNLEAWLTEVCRSSPPPPTIFICCELEC